MLKADRKNIFIFTSIAILVPISLMIFGTFAFAALIDKNIELQQSYSFSNVLGSKGTGDGKFLRPHDLEFDNHNKYLYAVDRDGNRIQVFDKNGTFLFKFGQKGDGGGQFLVPYGLDVDQAGNVWVADRGNHRIQKFDANWNPILMWGSKGSGDNQFCHMEHIALDKYDNVYVTDPQSDPGCTIQPRVLKFDSNGNFITKFGSFGKGPGQFKDPEHLSVDSEGNVYVSDRKNDNIQVFVRINKTMG